MSRLYWLPTRIDWAERLVAAQSLEPGAAWTRLVELAQSNLDLVRTERLARSISRSYGDEPPSNTAAPHVRLALLGSCTVEHLASSVRVAGARRNIWIDVYTGPYGQYLQELEDPSSALHQFAPTEVVLSVASTHLINDVAAASDAGLVEARLEQALDHLEHAWILALKLKARVIQQTLLPVLPPILGSNEHRLTWSPNRLVAEFNRRLRDRADRVGVDLLGLDDAIERDGISAWYDPASWFRAKQEIHPSAAPLFGDLVARLLAASAGRSAKCLVLDLDNTLWGGVIGDDGLDGIVLGQGSAVGEAHLALQAYALNLSRRGVILAVCSKNNQAVALEAFEKHPEMLLRRSDIACFVANWEDKATNMRSIAARLNIGIDSLVFVDDSPFERNIVRHELPMVNVPELPEDASCYVRCLSDAGYFEATGLTDEDLQRGAQYQANVEREAVRASTTDLAGYLKGLSMKLMWRSFDSVGTPRIAQLINKSNQFNLTTRRYSEDEVRAVMESSDAWSFQFRLVDKFGDNGMISVVIARRVGERAAEIDTWLMSCRVLGRGVEQAVLNIVVAEAKAAGIEILYGRYIASAKNGMVAQHYRTLGFEAVDRDRGDAGDLWALALSSFQPFPVFIEASKG